MLRKYRFMSSGQFELHQYYYADSSCHSPTYSVVARGNVKTGSTSWIVPGAVEAEYELAYVTVMPYTSHMARLLGAKVNRTCPGFVETPWRAYDRHVLFNYVEFQHGLNEEEMVVVDRDCTAALYFTLNELQLIRLEVRRRHLRLHRMLYLGDVHTVLGERQAYRPKSFQEPLSLREKPEQVRFYQSTFYFNSNFK